MASLGLRGLCAPSRQYHTSALQRDRSPRCSGDKKGKYSKLKTDFSDIKGEIWEKLIASSSKLKGHEKLIFIISEIFFKKLPKNKMSHGLPNIIGHTVDGDGSA